MAQPLAPVLQYLRHVRGDAAAPSDGQLLNRFLADRDEAAFAELIARHGAMVLGVCRRVLGNLHDAEDAFQATFLLLARKAASLRPELLGPWLHGVARRTSLKARARALRRRAREQPFLDPPAPERPNSVDLADLRPLLDEAVGGLPELYRVPFVLCHLQGMTQVEVARRLGCPTNTVTTRLARARQRLRVRLAGRGLAVSAGTLLALEVSAESPALSLVRTTLRTVTVPSAVPASVASLMEGVSRMMLMEKLRTTLVIAAAVGLTALAAGTFFRTAHAEEPRDAPPPALVEPPRTEAVAKTSNFRVEAPTPQAARLVLETAERHRKAQALAWLGKELPAWPEPCKIRVELSLNGAGGATSFQFDQGRVLSRDMHLSGSLERILANCLPHEVTHAILADYFRKPVPRWADEGASILSEDDDERERHGKLAKQVLKTPGRAIALRRLFGMSEYPRDVMALYAQGYAVTQFLVDKVDCTTFLKFVKHGQDEDWDVAVRKYYGYKTVEELEDDWLRAMLGREKHRTVLDRGRDRMAPEDRVKDAASGTPRGAAPAPVTALARVVDGQIELCWPVEFYQPVERAVPRENGEGSMRVTTYERFSNEVKRRFTPGQLRAYEVSGKSLNARQLTARLAKETAVLLAADGNDVDPFHLQLIKEGTLVLVQTTPPPAIGLMPPPAAPTIAPRER